MVKGVHKVRAKLRALPGYIDQAVRTQLEKEATKLVRLMETLKPIPEITVGWTWGDAPEGALAIGTVSQSSGDRIYITIYATGASSQHEDGFPALARWFEFGTRPRTQKKTGRYTGYIPASPYFYPAFRTQRPKIRRNLRAAVTRAVKKANAKG